MRTPDLRDDPDRRRARRGNGLPRFELLAVRADHLHRRGRRPVPRRHALAPRRHARVLRPAHLALAPHVLARLAAGKAGSIPVATAHPGPGDSYLARRFCSAFPHIYDGVVYLYDCDDTLAWKGTVTLRPS